MKPCTKKRFKTEIEANIRLQEILSTGEAKNGVVLKRSYKCRKCGRFHLTSMTKKKYQNTKDSQSRNKIREEMFIATETEYFNKKFNIRL